MAISSSQIKFYRSIYVNDSLTNGGRIGTTQMTDGSLNNLFRNVQSDEREAGIDLYRKFFIKNDNPLDSALTNPRMYISNISSGEDYFQIAAGTDSDNQGLADDYTDWCGSGRLAVNILSGENSLAVNCKQASGIPSGSSLILFDGVQRAEITMLGNPIWSGEKATIIVDGVIGSSFVAEETIVSAILPLNDITPTITDWFETSSAGTYNEETYPVILYNIGSITESWTLTFTSSTEFTVTGAVTGSLGNGTITGNFVPENIIGYYFNLNRYGWSGSWVAGDTITFKTTHAAQGVWIKESVPAGAESQIYNLFTVKLLGESI